MLHQQFSQEYPNVEQLQNSKVCMILIYANGCPYCDIMNNDWFKAKNYINKKYNTNDVNVVEIERNHANSLFNNSNDDFINTMRQETHGYPSIFFKTPIVTKKHNSFRQHDIFKNIIDLEMKKSKPSKKGDSDSKSKPSQKGESKSKSKFKSSKKGESKSKSKDIIVKAK